MTRTGLDRWRTDGFADIQGQRIGLIANQASVDRYLDHTLDLITGAGVRVVALFGPQHGLAGQTQDNMIEWEGHPEDGPMRVHSLYGAVRRPTPEMLGGIDRLVIDLQDVGARYYTFVWTACLALEACAESGVPVTVLDRPNPIGPTIEGPVLETGYESFVGGHTVPIRHGMTLGEIVALYARDRVPAADLTVVACEGEAKPTDWRETGLPWISPSPNMPTPETALVYPGGCLLEGTNLSEGRGTCRPFETFGAPFLAAEPFAAALNRIGLPGVRFRPVEFVPTFNKHQGKLCGGAFLHVLDPLAFRPVLSYIAVIQEAIRLSSFHEAEVGVGETFRTDSPEVDLPGFTWKLPPYEYVRDRMPIDILCGNGWMRPLVQSLAPLDEIRGRMDGG